MRQLSFDEIVEQEHRVQRGYAERVATIGQMSRGEYHARQIREGRVPRAEAARQGICRAAMG